MNTLHVDAVRGDVVTYRVTDRYGQTVSAGEQRIHRLRRLDDRRLADLSRVDPRPKYRKPTTMSSKANAKV